MKIDHLALKLGSKKYCISQFHLRPEPPPPGLSRGICPSFQLRGWGICKFCTAPGPGVCQPRGHSQAFDTHAPPGLPRGICPSFQLRGWGICKFCTARGPGVCQPRGHSQAFDTHAVSYQNITTQKVLLEKKRIGSSVNSLPCRRL